MDNWCRLNTELKKYSLRNRLQAKTVGPNLLKRRLAIVEVERSKEMSITLWFGNGGPRFRYRNPRRVEFPKDKVTTCP